LPCDLCAASYSRGILELDIADAGSWAAMDYQGEIARERVLPNVAKWCSAP